MAHRNDITIPLGEIALVGTMTVPRSPVGLIVFAGAGAQPSRLDIRVVALLEERGFATLLLGLLTPDEHREQQVDTTLHVDVDVLAERLIGAIDHLRANVIERGLPLALFSGSTTPAAVIAAARRIDAVSAIVCHDGRPDLAGAWLTVLRTPALLIAGSRDTLLLRANRDAARTMVAPHKVAVISGASRGFAEPGALDEVAAVAAAWLLDRLRVVQPRPSRIAATV